MNLAKRIGGILMIFGFLTSLFGCSEDPSKYGDWQSFSMNRTSSVRTDAYTSLFTQRNEVYSGSEATVFHLVKLFALQSILRHNYPIIIDSFRAEDLSTGKEKAVLEISKSLDNQVIFTTTLKHEEMGKYDSLEGVNHINYLSHTPSKILDRQYVDDFVELMNRVSVKIQD